MEVITSEGERITFPKQTGRRMILLKVNTACNLQCDYCWYALNPSLRVPVHEEASGLTMDRMLHEISAQKGDMVYLSGGEAVLHKEISQICQRIFSTGARVYLTTNGILQDRLRALAKTVHGYIVSLDSYNPHYHDRHRGNHQQTLNGIKELAIAAPVCVSVTLSRENLDELIPIAKAAIDMRAQGLFYQLLWLPTGTYQRDERCLQPKDAKKLGAILNKLDLYRNQLGLPHHGYRSLVEKTVEEGGASGCVHGCFAMDGYLTTDPRGSILKCLPYEFTSDTCGSEKVPWRAGVCHYLSEECMCLMGHFFSELFVEEYQQ